MASSSLISLNPRRPASKTDVALKRNDEEDKSPVCLAGGTSNTDSSTTMTLNVATNAFILHSVPGGGIPTPSFVIYSSSTGAGSGTSQSLNLNIDGRPKWVLNCLSQIYTHQNVRFLTSSSTGSNKSHVSADRCIPASTHIVTASVSNDAVLEMRPSPTA